MADIGVYRRRAPMAKPFGFCVERIDREKSWDETSPTLDEPRYRVWLPHQCDTWMIAGEGTEGGRAEDDFVSKAEAVEEFRRFIAEAHDALWALQQGAPFGDKYRSMYWDD
jgi:hypothetical protein